MPSVQYTTMEPSLVTSQNEEKVSAAQTDETSSAGLSISLVAIIIPSVILIMLCFVLIGFHVWKCYTRYEENEEAEKHAESQNKEMKKAPISEPEADFSPTVDILDAEVSTS